MCQSNQTPLVFDLPYPIDSNRFGMANRFELIINSSNVGRMPSTKRNLQPGLGTINVQYKALTDTKHTLSLQQ